MNWNFCLCFIQVILLCWTWKKVSIDFSNKLWKMMSTSPSSKHTNRSPPPWTSFTISLFPSSSSRIQRTWSLNDFFPFNFVRLLFILFISPFNPLAALLDFPWLGVLIGLLEVLGCCIDEPLATCILSWFDVCIAAATSSRTNFLINDSITLLKSKIKAQVKLRNFNILLWS